jgi:hypothetical protein
MKELFERWWDSDDNPWKGAEKESEYDLAEKAFFAGSKANGIKPLFALMLKRAVGLNGKKGNRKHLNLRSINNCGPAQAYTMRNKWK